MAGRGESVTPLKVGAVVTTLGVALTAGLLIARATGHNSSQEPDFGLGALAFLGLGAIVGGLCFIVLGLIERRSRTRANPPH